MSAPPSANLLLFSSLTVCVLCALLVTCITASAETIVFSLLTLALSLPSSLCSEGNEKSTQTSGPSVAEGARGESERTRKRNVTFVGTISRIRAPTVACRRVLVATTLSASSLGRRQPHRQTHTRSR